jgi:multidrug efflux pump subunit AcrA (membrane-fusion protein)
MWRHAPLLVASLALAATACTSADVVEVGSARVTSGEVVQTVAAGAELEAADRVTVNAPVGGEVAELLVGDGDQVRAGDPLVRLASDTIDQQVMQAEMAVEAAEMFAGSAADAGFDLSPVVGAFGAQLEAVFPPLLGALGDQIATLESAALNAERERQQLQADLDAARRDIQSDLDAARDGLVDLDAARRDLVDQATDALPDVVEEELPEGVSANDPLPVPDLEVPSIGVPQLVDPDELHRAAADARVRLAEAEAGYREARGQLAQVQSDLEGQARQASEVQAAAAGAQLDQAEVALEAARARVDDLVIVAPAAGVVELARGGDGGVADAPDLGALGGAGDLGDLGALGGLLGGDGGGSSTSSTGPLAEGVGVGAGQALLTIFDLSGFTARVDVDEIDIVEMEVGQAVTVLVDAFPDAELSGTVGYIALEPQRPPGGGAIFPVTVRLDPVPDEVGLRIGLTASAEIEVRRLQGETVIPTSALLRRGGGEVVYVVRGGSAVEVPIGVEAIGDDTAAVTGDLEVGDEVVTTGVELVEDGTEVEVVG